MKNSNKAFPDPQPIKMHFLRYAQKRPLFPVSHLQTYSSTPNQAFSLAETDKKMKVIKKIIFPIAAIDIYF